MPAPCLSILAVLMFCSAPASRAADKGGAPVSFELVTEPDLNFAAGREWFDLLTELGVAGLQIRTASGRGNVEIEDRGSEGSPAYHVTAIVRASNVLEVPGGRFTLRDRARLANWISELRERGPEAATGRKDTFGLTASQNRAVQDDLSTRLGGSTRGVALGRAVEALGRSLHFKLVVPESAAPALEDQKVSDELRGLARGTALAIMLRPAKLAFRPEHSDGSVVYTVVRASAQADNWPAGRISEKRPLDVAPDLFKSLNVEINKTPVTEALSAIEGRVDMPFVFDRYALALHQIDLKNAVASVPSRRLTYSLVLQKVLSSARLKPEVRLDDAGKPFVWITTIKRT